MAKIMKLVVCDSNNQSWKLVKHRRAYAYRETHYNGETHYQGFWLDSMCKFELPSVFFGDADKQDFSEETDKHLLSLYKELIFGKPVKAVPKHLKWELHKRKLIEVSNGVYHS